MSQESIKKGDAIPPPCPDCGRALKADHDFILTASGDSYSGSPPAKRELFWSATCAGCGIHVNYVPDSGRVIRHGPPRRWSPPLDPEQFKGVEGEMLPFVKQQWAVRAREDFQQFGRGAMVVYLDRTAKTVQGRYCTTFDESEQARQVRSLVEIYDPAVQAVLQFRDARPKGEIVIPQDGAVAAIVDIETKH